MAKRKRLFLLFLIGISIFHLAGCGNNPDSVEDPMENGAISDMGHAEDVLAEAETDTSILSEENQGRAAEEPETKDGEALDDPGLCRCIAGGFDRRGRTFGVSGLPPNPVCHSE